MNRLIILMLITGGLSGCAIRLSPISASYARNPIVITKVAASSIDQPWARLVKLVADKDLSIKTMDKGSGFMQTDIMSFVNAYEMDSEKALRSNPPYVLVQNEMVDVKRIEPSYITGSLKIIMLPEKDSVRIQVSIDGLKSYHLIHSRKKGHPAYKGLYRDVVSTKKLENDVSDYISGRSDSISLYTDKGVIVNPKDNYEAYLRRNTNIFIGCYVGAVGAACIITGIIVLKNQ